MSFPELIADLVCPALGVGVFVSPLIRRAVARSPWVHWASAGAAVLWVYALALADRWSGWWCAAGLDFSTHFGVALSLAVALRWHGRLAQPLIGGFLLGYAALLIGLEYHSALDIATSAAATVPVAVVASRS